jgi:hypothetical protein
MTFEFSSWFGRTFSAAAPSTPNGHRDHRAPLKIEVERMPDYLWGALGFPQPRRRGEEK